MKESSFISKKRNQKGFENAIVLNCEEQQVTAEVVKAKINQAIDEKRPLIIESIGEMVFNAKNMKKQNLQMERARQ